MDTNRTTDSLDVFPTNYFNQQLQEIESNMKILSSDTQNSKKINLNNENAYTNDIMSAKSNKSDVLGDYTRVGKKVMFNDLGNVDD